MSFFLAVTTTTVHIEAREKKVVQVVPTGGHGCCSRVLPRAKYRGLRLCFARAKPADPVAAVVGMCERVTRVPIVPPRCWAPRDPHSATDRPVASLSHSRSRLSVPRALAHPGFESHAEERGKQKTKEQRKDRHRRGKSGSWVRKQTKVERRRFDLGREQASPERAAEEDERRRQPRV